MISTEYMHRFTQCATPTGRRRHWGAAISAQHPLARAGAPAGTLAAMCVPSAYATAAAACGTDSDLKPCAWCAKNIHPFPEDS